MMKDFFAHETAVIDEGVEIGDGTRIWHFTLGIDPPTTLEGVLDLPQVIGFGCEATIGNSLKDKGAEKLKLSSQEL